MNYMMDVHTCGEAMVKSEGEVFYPDELPEFFKVYMSALWSERMRIPPAFIENFGGKIPRKVMLGTPSNLSWQVRINKINDDLFFEGGWPEFVQENSLAHGEFLTFCYAGNSKFYVKIFSTNGCRKRLATRSMIKKEPIKLLQGNETSRPGKSYCMEAPQGNRHSNALVLRKSRGKYPSFEMVMTKTYIHQGLLHIPAHFVNVYLKTSEIGERTATLEHKDKSWPVVVANSSNRTRFSQGWTKFVRDNSLVNGNTCNFKLIDRNDLVFKVTVS